MTNSRRALVLSLLAILPLGVTACGDDKATEAGAVRYPAYCDASLKIEGVQPDIDFQSSTPEQIKTGIQAFAKDKLRPMADTIVSTAPAAAKADIAVLSGAVDQLIVSGDFQTVFDAPAVKTADKNNHAFNVENCGWTANKTNATEYDYQGLTTQVKPGPMSFELYNKGAEMHEMVVLKKKAGVTESFDDLLKLDEQAAQQKVDQVASVDPTKPGENDYAVANLEKGEYLVACFLPKGATPDLFAQIQAGTAQPPQGAVPHAALGMHATVTVA